MSAANRALFLMGLIIAQSACTVVVSGDAMEGRVIDDATDKPIPGALVIAEWSADIGGPVQSSRVCFHLEVATTDVNGRYRIPRWSRPPAADWEGGFFGLRNVEVTRRTYKDGYTHLRYDPRDASTILMTHLQGNVCRANRLPRLHEGTPGCGKEDGTRKKEVGYGKQFVMRRSEFRVRHSEALTFMVNRFWMTSIITLRKSTRKCRARRKIRQRIDPPNAFDEPGTGIMSAFGEGRSGKAIALVALFLAMAFAKDGLAFEVGTHATITDQALQRALVDAPSLVERLGFSQTPSGELPSLGDQYVDTSGATVQLRILKPFETDLIQRHMPDGLDLAGHSDKNRWLAYRWCDP